ncbi:hypothetical protein RI367_006604 [Sorochytrium milnesiophthora]
MPQPAQQTDRQPLLEPQPSAETSDTPEQYLYWVRRPVDEEAAEESEFVDAKTGGCAGLRQLLALKWRVLVGVLVLLGVTAATIYVYARPSRSIFLDIHTDLDTRQVQLLQMQILGFSEGRIRFVTDHSLPPYLVRLQEQMYEDTRHPDDDFSHRIRVIDLNSTAANRGGYKLWAGVPQSRYFDGTPAWAKYLATIRFPPSAAAKGLRKRDSSHGIDLNITSENLDIEWDVRDTNLIHSVLLQNENGGIKGKLSAQHVDIRNANGGVDLALSMVTPQAPSPGSVQVSTSSGDMSLDVSILGAADERRAHKRDQGAPSSLRIQAHSGNGHVRATYTVPAVSPDPHHFKDGFQIDFLLRSKRGTSLVTADTSDSRGSSNDRLSPTTAVLYSHDNEGWALGGNITSPNHNGLPSVFGSSVDISLTTVRGDVALYVH